MKNLFKKALVLVGVSVFVVACSKYEDGPKLSLRSKKARLAGEWKAVKVLSDGTDVTSTMLPSGSEYNVTIDKGGSYTYQILASGTVVWSGAGKWEFVDKKENLKMVETGSTDTDGDTSVITMLKNKELHTKDKNGSPKMEIYYEAK